MAFTNIPQYLLGRSSTYVVTPCTVAADGTITEVTASAQTITARLMSCGDDYAPVTEEISPITAIQNNHVVIATDNTFDVEEIVPATGISGLELVGAGWTYVKIAHGFGSTPKSKTFFGVIAGLGSRIASKGKVTVTMRVAQSGGNDVNPVLA